MGVKGNDYDSFSIGISLKVANNGTIKTQFASISGKGSTNGATMYALGYDHKLADTTSIYVAYASTDNEASSQFSVNGKGHGDAITPAFGENPTAFSIGIVSSFDISITR